MEESFPSESEGEIYKKLQEKRSFERHNLSMGREEKKNEPFTRAFFEFKKEFFDKKAADGANEEKQEEKKEAILEIKEKEKIIEEEIARLGATSRETQQIKSASEKRLKYFFSELRRVKNLIKKSKSKLDEFKKDAFSKEVSEVASYTYSKINEWEEFNAQMESYIKNELPGKNPESFMAHWLLKLGQYKKELPSGIIETDYVKEQKERAKDVLLKNKLIALLGETGTGKTELAGKIATELTGEYEFVNGHAFMTKEDLFSYVGIDVSETPPEEVPELIHEAKRKYFEKTAGEKELSEEEKKEKEKWIEDTVKGQAAQLEMKTKIFNAAVKKAAEEGKVLIIDEFNFIPSELLAGINAYTGPKARGVKKGFGIILTGNITVSEVKNRYLKREESDAPLINRLNSGFIVYNFLPQDANLSFYESILTKEEVKSGEEIPKRELFELALTLLTDKKKNLSGRQDTLEKAWDISCEFSLLQKIYSGEKTGRDIKLLTGETVSLKKYAVSNRTFRSVVESWKKEGFEYSLDWYLYDNVIRPASGSAPSEAVQMWTLFKERGGFFQDPVWDKIEVDMSTWQISGIEDIESERKEFKGKLKVNDPVHYFTAKEISEAMAGVEMPEFETKEYKKDAANEEMERKYEEALDKLEKMENFVHEWEHTIELFCEDERNIYPVRN